MDAKRIGKAIRELRKDKKLTQAQLAQGIVTRNMLSLIENGSATPSLQTLENISERLGVSPAYFFTFRNDFMHRVYKDHEEEVKKAYYNQKYDKCLELFNKYYGLRSTKVTDELLLIGAESAMRVARQKVLKGAFESAVSAISYAKSYSDKCKLNTDWIYAQVFLYEAIIENTDCPAQALDKDYSLKVRRTTDSEIYNYLYAIRLLDDSKGDEAAHFLKHNRIIDAGHKDHINAKFMLLSDSQLLKKEALDSLIGMIRQAPIYPLNAISRYLILKDIEYAARAIDDYEMAYKYASMRLKIISDMRD